MANYHDNSEASSITVHDDSQASRTNPITSEKDEEELPPKNQSSPDLPVDSQQEEKTETHGRIIGGTYRQDYHESSDESKFGPLKEVDADIPLTLWELKTIEEQEYIILKFVEGDKENPYNWSQGRKAFITLLLCLMTLFIGLATTAYSSGISSMVADLGTSNILGQMGLFCFNEACALAPVSVRRPLSLSDLTHRAAFPCSIL